MSALPIVPPPLSVTLILFPLLGALSAMMANRAVCVFHDGLRPMMPAIYESKSMSRTQISAISFALMIGFFVGFAVPFSIGIVIPLCYLIFLVTDWIGVSLPGEFKDGWLKDKKSLLGFIGSGVLGGAWGAFMAVGVGLIPQFAEALPVDMLNPMTYITPALIACFVSFPVLAIGYRFGIKKGAISLLAVLIARQVSILLGAPDGNPWVLASGTVILLYLAFTDKRSNETIDEASAKAMEDIFEIRVNRIKQYTIPLVLLSALIGIAINFPAFALDPPQGPLMAEGRRIEAAIVLFSLGIAFFPMKFSTALLSGSMMTFSFFDAAIQY